jgi:hypothetical protein
MAVVLTGIALAAGAPTSIAFLACGSLVRPVVYSLTALRVQPDPLRTLAAFVFLPVYALWRLGAAAAALSMVGDKPWVRTGRHGDPPAGRGS